MIDKAFCVSQPQGSRSTKQKHIPPEQGTRTAMKYAEPEDFHPFEDDQAFTLRSGSWLTNSPTQIRLDTSGWGIRKDKETLADIRDLQRFLDRLVEVLVADDVPHEAQTDG